MLKVSLDDLKKLLPSGISEGVESSNLGGLSFKDACTIWHDGAKSGTVRQAYAHFVEAMASKCPPIVLVGEGSSRTAFACIGGLCMKAAKKDVGIAQNKHEAKHTMKKWWKKNWSCFVQTYGATRDYGLLLSECCSPMESEQQLVKALGMSKRDVLTAAVWALANLGEGDIKKSWTSMKSKCSEWRAGRGSIDGIRPNASACSAAEEAAEWLGTLAKNSRLDAGQKQFLQIADFWKKRGVDELLPGDVSMWENWGFAIRNGEIAPVMLDIGFSKEVADMYYI